MVIEMSLDMCELTPGVQSITISKLLSQARLNNLNLTRDQLTNHVEDLCSPHLEKPNILSIVVEKDWGRNHSVTLFSSSANRFFLKASISKKFLNALLSLLSHL